MKKILFKILFTMILSMPFVAFAAGSINISSSSATLEYGASQTFTITAYNVMGDMTITSNNPNVASVSPSSWETGVVGDGQTQTGTFTVTGVGAGSTTITIVIDAYTFDEEQIPSPRTINITVKPPKSSDASLSSLTVDGTNILSSLKYTTSKSSVNVEATATDSNRRDITGTGYFELKCGSNSKNIVVTAENGLTRTYTIVVTRTCSSNNNLRSLTVDKGSLSPSFYSGTLNYNVSVDASVNTIKISAAVDDSKSKMTGDGTKSLKFGTNSFPIVVTAEDGSTKTYTIIVTREDTRSDDASLKSLVITDTNFTFEKDKTNYTANVENSVETVKVTAVANDSKAKVSGSVGTQRLNVGSNKLTITVTAENESKRVYTITIIRKDESGNVGDLDSDNTLSSLSLVGCPIDFKPDVYKYDVELDEYVDYIEVDAFANSLNAYVSITGNNNLKPGVNVIVIEVTAESGDVRTYEIRVTLPGNEVAGIEASPETKTNSKKTSSKIVLIIGGICLLSGLGGLLFFLLSKKKNNKKDEPIKSEAKEEPKVESASLSSSSLGSSTSGETKKEESKVEEPKKEEPKQEEKIPDIQISDLKVGEDEINFDDFDLKLEAAAAAIDEPIYSRPAEPMEPKVNFDKEEKSEPPIGRSESHSTIPEHDSHRMPESGYHETLDHDYHEESQELERKKSDNYEEEIVAGIKRAPEEGNLEDTDDVSATQIVEKMKEVSVVKIDDI